MELTNTLKRKLEDLTGRYISANTTLYKKIREGVFKEFHVTKWEEIAIGDFHKAHAFIDSIEEI